MAKVPGLGLTRDEPQAPAPGEPVPEQYFKVLESTKVKRFGSHYSMPAGKVISSAGHNIDELKKLGVKLEACEPPVAVTPVFPG